MPQAPGHDDEFEKKLRPNWNQRVELVEPPPEVVARAKAAYGQEWRRRRSWRAVRLGAVFVLMFAALGFASITIAQASVPGEALYTLKRESEAVQVALAQDAGQRTIVHLGLAQQRLQEAHVLVTRSELGFLPALLREYEQEIKTAAQFLNAAAQENTRTAGALISKAKAQLESNIGELSALQSQAPPSANRIFDEAINSTQDVLRHVPPVSDGPE